MEEIITSRLDTDFYNFTMGQVIWRHFGITHVKYKLFNRGNSLNIDIEELIEQINAVRELSFSESELKYLYNLGVFDPNYLIFLSFSKLPPVRVYKEGADVQLEFEGSWSEAVFWETPLLAIISELSMRSQAKTIEKASKLITRSAYNRLEEKIKSLNKNPELKLMEFGSRRRYSTEWQNIVVENLTQRCPRNLLGSSNVLLAKKFNILPLGTMAHQLFMVTTAIFKQFFHYNYIENAQNYILDIFEKEFSNNPELLVFLPDTYGTTTGLKYFSTHRASTWTGIRQDSGSPSTIIETLINFYRSNGINPLTKKIIASDGLSIEKALALQISYSQETNLSFGVGTHLTNDTMLKPPNTVIKPVSVLGAPCVKLSDSIGKELGSEKEIASYQKLVLDTAT